MLVRIRSIIVFGMEMMDIGYCIYETYDVLLNSTDKNINQVVTSMDFISKIRQSSETLHEATEHTGIIKKLVEGNASIEEYAEYLFNLSAMYKIIEETIEENRSNEVVKEFATKELYRFHLIEQDLAYFSKEKESKFELCASTMAMVARVKEIGINNPELIIAYAYTRFLADLFGGRMFAELLGNSYKVPAEGLNYYKCDRIQDIRTYVMNYAMKINALNFTEDMQEKMLNEVRNAYIYNLAISCELDVKRTKLDHK